MFVMPLLIALILSLRVHFELDLKGFADYRFNDVFCSQRWVGLPVCLCTQLRYALFSGNRINNHYIITASSVYPLTLQPLKGSGHPRSQV